MITLRADRSPSSFPKAPTVLVTTADSYYVELPLEALDEQGRVLDSVIGFTFDTLHVQRLDLRIVAETRSLRHDRA